MMMPPSTDPVEPASQNTDPVNSLDVAAVEGALGVAIRAPSIHNTQPWRFELRGGVLALRADRSRQLGIADPDGHSLLISCGAALALTELALRAAGWTVEVRRVPDPADPDLLAELRGLGHAEPLQVDLDRVAASRRRRSERRPFAAGRPAEQVIERLRQAAASPGVDAHFPIRADENLDLAVAVSYADRFQRKDPDYLAEMARWTQQDDHHADGIPPPRFPTYQRAGYGTPMSPCVISRSACQDHNSSKRVSTSSRCSPWCSPARIGHRIVYRPGRR